MEKNTELLSPAGSFRALELAIANGANAVYLGLEKFSARAKAENFTQENLEKAVTYAHLYGVKVYIAINTLIKDLEIEQLLSVVDKAIDAKVDAFILQSLGIASELKKIYPEIVLHASTQMGVHNIYGAKMCKNAGFSRIVLSRETTFEDIKAIKQNVDIELEVFIHGAMCVSFSGNCYMSSIINCNSGNRGRCLQPCRLLYSYKNSDNQSKNKSGYGNKAKPNKDNLNLDGALVNADNQYFLSLSDLCIAEKIKEFSAIGIDSFKIEGRMRRPEYAGYVTYFYRKLLDDINPTEKDYDNLKSIFNRGDFTEGHYFGDKNIASPLIQGHKGLYIGKVESIDKNGCVTVKSHYSILKNDGFKIIREGFEVGSAVAIENVFQNIYRLAFKGDVKIYDDVYLTTSTQLIKEIGEAAKKLSVNMDFTALIGQRAELTLSYDGLTVTIKSEQIIEKREKVTDEEQQIKNQILDKLNRTKDTVFEFSQTNIKCTKDAFIPVSLLKSLRREAVLQLEGKILERYEKKYLAERNQPVTQKLTFKESYLNNNQKNDIALSMAAKGDKAYKKSIVCMIDSLNISNHKYIDYLIFNPADYNDKNFNIFFQQLKDKGICTEKVFLNLPIITSQKDYSLILQLIENYAIKGVYVNNVGGIEFAKQMGLKPFLGHGLNIFNGKDILFYSQFSDKMVLSMELSFQEIKKIPNYESLYILGYGHLELMTLNHCIKKTVKNQSCTTCDKDNINIYDRINTEFKIKRYKLSKCYFNVLNDKKLNIFSRRISHKKYILDLRGESLADADKLIEDVYNNSYLCEEMKNFTGGHFYRGIL